MSEMNGNHEAEYREQGEGVQRLVENLHKK